MDEAFARCNPRGRDVHLRSGPQLQEYLAIADRIAADHPGRILDWGCGLGQMTRFLRDRGLTVTALDYRGDLPADGEFPLEAYPDIRAHLTSDQARLPFAHETFDAVLSCGVLEHVADPEGSLAELRRVLRPGGTLYIYKLPNRYSYLEALAQRIGLYYHGAYVHDRIYSRKQAVALLERCAFRVRSSRHQNLLPLTLTGRAMMGLAPAIWRLNNLLSRVPAINRLATNIEIVAERPWGGEITEAETGGQDLTARLN